MSAPLKPHWTQPSHPAIQEVLFGSNGDSEFTTKSISRVELPPFALFAPMASPPVTPAAAATYATVQVGRHQHINLNSDLLYINHSCEPSLLFDTASRNIWVGPNGLRPGDELTFFYPSTEWDMAQSFSCFCGTPSCRGRIGGARNMSTGQLAGLWLNGHIWELLNEQKEQQQIRQQQKTARPENGTSTATAAAAGAPSSAIEQALQEALAKAEASLHKADQAAEAARRALAAHRNGSQTTATASATTNGTTLHHHSSNGTNGANGTGTNGANGTGTNGTANGTTNGTTNGGGITTVPNGAARHGTSSRELGGELGGDTERT